MMLALLIYAYSHGVRSSRVIERLCRRDAGYRFIVGDEAPDHRVARFRQRADIILPARRSDRADVERC